MNEAIIDYPSFNDQWLIADLLYSIDYKLMAKHARYEHDGNILSGYVNFLKYEAKRRRDPEILTQLYLGGLIFRHEAEIL